MTILVTDANGAEQSVNTLPNLGQAPSATSLPVVLASDQGALPPNTIETSQDPIFDHANGVAAQIGAASTTLFTPPAGCKYARIWSDTDILIHTNNGNAADDGKSVRILANSPEVVPVLATVKVNAISTSGTANVRVMPMKAR